MGLVLQLTHPGFAVYEAYAWDFFLFLIFVFSIHIHSYDHTKISTGFYLTCCLQSYFVNSCYIPILGIFKHNFLNMHDLLSVSLMFLPVSNVLFIEGSIA